MSDLRSRRWASLAGRAHNALARVKGQSHAVPANGAFRYAVGGLWDEMGAAQFDYLVAEGLRPEHRLLDIGCGTLRGGVRFIPFLDPGNYFGIDISQEMLDAGEQELALAGISNRRHTLRQTSDFEMRFEDTQFDYALAQSVFTHIDLNQILRCLLNVQRVLAPAGRFYATFFENPAGKNSLDPVRRPQPDVADTVTFLDRDPFHYSLDAFEWACAGTDLKVDCIADWCSPRGQKMLLFRRVG
jgi:SAM-dependent methyltransferase